MEEVKGGMTPATDVEKLYAFMSYITFFGILVYRTKKDSDFVQFHAKQGIVLFVATLLNFILMALPVIGWFLMPFLNLAIFVLFVIGSYNALSGNVVKLPVIGKFENMIK